MRATTDDAGKLTLEGDTPDELTDLGLRLRQPYRITALRKRAVEFTPGVLPVASWLVAVREAWRVWVQAAPDWFVALGHLGTTWALLLWVTTRTPPRLALGAGLVAFVTGATLAGALSWAGVRPTKVSRRWWRWGYWLCGLWLALALGAITFGVLGWLALLAGALAQRLSP
jgi:hypothetical protein